MLQVANLQISLCTWQSDTQTTVKKTTKILTAIECVSICRLLLISDLSLLTSKLLLWRRISQPNHYLLCKHGPVTAQSFVKDRQLQQSEQLIPHGKVQE